MKNSFDNKKFRDGWVSVNVKRGLATQLRELRGALTQGAFGEKIGKPQSVVARLEDPNYGNMSIQTLLEIASRLDVGLLVKFVPFGRVILDARNLTHAELAPLSYEAEKKANAVTTPAQDTRYARLGTINGGYGAARTHDAASPRVHRISRNPIPSKYKAGPSTK